MGGFDVEIGEFIRVAFASERGAGPRAARHLQPGDRLQLKVVEVREDQRVLVDFGKFRALAEVSFPVRPGEEMSVKVIDTQGQLRLQLVRATVAESDRTSWIEPIRPLRADVLSRLYAQLERVLESAAWGRSSRTRTEDAASILESLRQALEPLQLETGSDGVARRVRAVCEDSGLFFEKRLEAALARENTRDGIRDVSRTSERPDVQRILVADLKARLGAVKHLLVHRTAEPPGLAAGARAELRRSVDELLQAIFQQQDQAVAAQKGSDPFQLIHFHLPMRDARIKAQLKISYPKKGGGKTKYGHRAALLLDFDRLGSIRVDLFLLDRELSMAFWVESDRARQALESCAEELRAAVSPGFARLQLTVAVLRRPIADFEAEDLRPATRSRLDVHA